MLGFRNDTVILYELDISVLIILSRILPAADVRIIELSFKEPFLSPFLKVGVMFASLN